MASSGDDIFITQSNTRKDLDSVSNMDNNGLENNNNNIVNSDIKDTSTTDPNFDLKFDWYSDSDSGDFEPDPKIQNKSRFSAPLQSEDLQKLVKEGLSVQTENKSRWAVNLFQKWLSQRTKATPSTSRSTVELLSLPTNELNDLLTFFIAEVRNESGGNYKPNTLYEIIIAIQHHLRQNGRFVSFLDDTDYQGLRSVLDAKMKELAKAGHGIKTKRADVITEDQEDILWEKGILGDDTPQKLLDTLVYQFGLHFALRAGQEHRTLRVGKLSQLSVGLDGDNRKFIQYTEDVSKSNRGGLNHRRIQPKITRAYANLTNISRCPVILYEKYMSLRPKEGKVDAFYLRPRKFTTSDVWYCDSPIGVHLLQQTVKRICQKAGFEGNYTNHSLRATAATRLYAAGIDEQLIVEKTGHRSNAVRTYKRTSEQQQADLSGILHCEKRAKVSVAEQYQHPVRNESEKKKSEIIINTSDISITMKF